MSKEYVEANRQKLIERLFERLQTVEDGTSVTTTLLLQSEGYDMRRFDHDVLMDIDYELKTSANDYNLILDMSHHENKVEGLPFNLDFIVHHTGDRES